MTFFNKRTWLARIGVGLNKFRIGGGSPQTLENAPDEITQEGDALSATNLNDLESRIEVAVPKMNMDETPYEAQYLQDLENVVVGDYCFKRTPLYNHIITIQLSWSGGNNLKQCISFVSHYKTPLTSLASLMAFLDSDFSALPTFVFFSTDSGGSHRIVTITGLYDGDNSYCYAKTQADSARRTPITVFYDHVMPVYAGD